MSRRKEAAEPSHNNTQRYGLYCLNIYGCSLNTIKEQFKNQVRTGLRQTVFIIDLDEELNNQNLTSKQHEELLNNYNMFLINIIQQNIQKCLKDYNWLMKKINEELKFNLYEYWLKQMEENKKFLPEKKLEKTVVEKPKEKTNKSKTRKSNSTRVSLKQEVSMSSNKTIITKQHNRIGQGVQYSKRKYIKDEPTQGLLSIIIMGQMNDDFYLDLLSRNLPLEGIMNFVPAESYYDIMVGNNILRNFIVNTISSLSASIYKMRQEMRLKPIGLFFYHLPVISTCLATKYSQAIFDQLTWTVFDIEMLKKQYDLYYYRPFQMTNVEIPACVDLTHYYHMAEILSMQGPYDRSNLPKCGTDLTTIASYLNSLLNTCGLTMDIKEDIYLKTSKFKNSFLSLTKIPKLEKIIVDASNRLLLNMLEYTDLSRFQSVYNCCLDYNIFVEYIFYPQNIPPPKKCCEKIDKIKSFLLPPYVKYYVNADCSSQRICNLIETYDDYQIDEIENGYKLYIFKKHFNGLVENEGVVVIPTRLCFRDFTLFQMAEFLENLRGVSTQQNQNLKSDQNSNQKTGNNLMELNEDIYIRINSLKALYLQKNTSRETMSQSKTDSRSSRSKIGKKSSFSDQKDAKDIEEGLSPDHRLLKGYNLDDTLQEVKFKTSKYNFSHGSIQLYEERWCFQDMNKQLTLNINDTRIVLNRPRNQQTGLSNSLRLITKNDISIRILNEPQEYNKIVMNYPNGLSIYYNENVCIQDWNCEQSKRDEQCRIYTAYGCIIAFYSANAMILIMRYNGEVYQLFQHELDVEEEQSFNTESLEDFQDSSSGSGINDMKAQGDCLFVKKGVDKKRQNSNTSQNKRNSKKNSEYQRNCKNLSSEESSLNRKLRRPLTGAELKKIIENELKFLDFISSANELKYLHLIVTTAQGRRVNINSKGEIYESQPCHIKAWRDYFANEDYCERSDGVKMIWTKDCLKCYHKDGTVFTTTTEEGLINPDTEDFDSQITQSSSHMGQEEESAEEQPRLTGGGKKTLREHLNFKDFRTDEGIEEHMPEDTKYVGYSCSSWFMQHRCYADVQIETSQLYPLIQPIEMKIFGIDNIRLYMQAEPFLKGSSYNFCESDMETATVNEDNEEEGAEVKIIVHVWIDDMLHVTAKEEACEISAVISETVNESKSSDAVKSSESDSLTLRLKYSDYINDAFKYLINEIASRKAYNESRLEKLYFIETINNDSSTKGFEFFSELPLNSEYIYHKQNIITELKVVSTRDELMNNNFVWYEQDMKKFPRLKPQQPPQLQLHKKTKTSKYSFPYVLSSNIFIEIPRLLRSSDDIIKFLEPFEEVNFKSLRTKFQNAINFCWQPQSEVDLKHLQNLKYWKVCHFQHRRRLFVEQQRLGLYYAMNKHKIYPGYWKFYNDYKGLVHYIEFFEFMQNKCESKEKDNQQRQNQ